MVIFVTGPSGFIGSNLLRRLIKERYRVIGLFRNPPDTPLSGHLAIKDFCNLSGAKQPHNAGGHLEVVKGDINHPDTYITALSQTNCVFHCAAHIGFRKADYDLAYLINVEGTRALLDACHKVGVSKVVHLSACAVLGYSESVHRLIDESSKPIIKRDNAYAYTKTLAEGIAFEYAAKGLDVSIANIATVYGAGDKRLNSGSVIKTVYEGKAKVIPQGGTSFVAVDDLVEGLILMSQRGKAGERYILCSENMTYSDLFKRIAWALGLKRRFIVLPKSFKYPAIFLAGLIERLLPAKSNGVNLISEQLIRESFGYKYYNNQKARSELGWHPLISLEEAVRDAFDYYRSQGLI